MTTGNEKPSKTNGPKAVMRVLDLLLLLANHPEGLTLAELSSALSVPKSTFLATLRGLCEQDFLVREEGKYCLGFRSHHFANKIVSNWSAPDMVRLQVKALSRKTQESVGFAIVDWELGQAIYTEAVNSTQPVRYAMRAGIRAPLYASAAGRVLLAYASSDRCEAYLAHTHLKQLTSSTRTDIPTLKTHLQHVRRDGYCASFGEMLDDTAALAVPVLKAGGSALGAMILAAPLKRMKDKYAALLDALIAAGHNASAVPADHFAAPVGVVTERA